jgi:integrase
MAKEGRSYASNQCDLQAAIRCGALRPGDRLPSLKAAQYSVSEETAHGAITLLSASGEARTGNGRRAVVIAQSKPSSSISGDRYNSGNS